MIITKDSPEYEQTRIDSMWGKRTPDRRPSAFVPATTADDVADAVRLATTQDLPITVRAGGHNWSGSHLRDSAVVIDVSAMDEVSVDEESMTAVAGPGVGGSVLAEELDSMELFFPAGHCRGVKLGGYLLQGGFGWNSRALGPACMSVNGVDVVLADGSQVHADANENADLYWAARGSGTGFFGVVTRFHLQLHRKPAVFANAVYVFAADVLDELYRWAFAIRREVPRTVELMLLMAKHLPGAGVPGIVLTAPVFADSEVQARADLAFINDCPVLNRALMSNPYFPTTLHDGYSGTMTAYPDNTRWGTDNMWTHGPIDTLVPALDTILDTMPPEPSHCLWMNWSPPADRPDMAFSVEDDIYIATYGGWQSHTDDDAYGTWAAGHMTRLEPVATGIQLADENLGQRPARFLSEANMARFDTIRDHYDPDHRFAGWLSRPPADWGRA